MMLCATNTGKEEERLVLEQIELLVRHTVLQRPLDMNFILTHAEMLVQFAECARVDSK